MTHIFNQVNLLTQILYAYEDEGGEDLVASLDFWSKPPQ